jgi:hypothetical protein
MVLVLIPLQLRANYNQYQPYSVQEGENSSPFPNTRLNPDQVVRIQLEALRTNDENDRGIEITFRFASPANKRSTGPLERFARMIKTTPYSWMINYHHVQFDPVIIEETRAVQRVTIIGEDYTTVSYIFHLSKQTEGSCRGCWMTDAVFIEPPKSGGSAI